MNKNDEERGGRDDKDKSYECCSTSVGCLEIKTRCAPQLSSQTNQKTDKGDGVKSQTSVGAK